MSRSIVVALGLAVFLGTSVAQPQTQAGRRALTTADYDRATKMLGPSLTGLVMNDTVNVNWLADGRLWYVRTTSTGTENVVVDPAKKSRETVATPPAEATVGGGAGGRGGRGRGLPPEALAQGGGAGGRGGRGGGGVALSKTCGPNVTGMTGPPPASMSPDGNKAIFICDWNLWVRDTASGQDRQLTKDGQVNFGYATSNAGWTTSP
ncbi:MAG TPA: DPP IV N-terminal domain-containing protein, partial [Vicinamibacterales bacterium]|nr:DPP IV N-terminal domain-containing protein [Vicinamibacterales bacterium]